ncbi:MAG: hypothetical protein AABX89_06565 [Candidatus Thermoplasmatota archaeon]
MPAAAKRPWRAWDTFVAALAVCFASFLAFLLASVAAHAAQGDLNREQSELLLGLLRYGTYPLVFLALGALGWHYVKSETGGYARR